jgi:hypothetical protein
MFKFQNLSVSVKLSNQGKNHAQISTIASPWKNKCEAVAFNMASEFRAPFKKKKKSC